MKTKAQTILIICLAGYAGIHDFYLEKNNGIGLLKLLVLINFLVLFEVFEILSWYVSPGNYYGYFLLGLIVLHWLNDLIRFIKISPRKFHFRYNYKPLTQ